MGYASRLEQSAAGIAFSRNPAGRKLAYGQCVKVTIHRIVKNGLLLFCIVQQNAILCDAGRRLTQAECGKRVRRGRSVRLRVCFDSA